MTLLNRANALVCGFLLSLVLAANGQEIYCVRSGATGANNGGDWVNAYASLPSTLKRGATYYVADGSYSGYDFNDPNSGASYIYIKKATNSDHGPEAGWSAGYGDGQAVFGASSVSTGYYDISGQTEYGIKIDFSEGQTGMEVGGSSCAGVKLQYIDFDGRSETGNYNYTAGTKCIVIGRGITNLLISHCALHGGESLMQEGDGNTSNGFDSSGTTVEYCHFYNARSTASNYHNNVYFMSGSQNGTFRYNRVHDYNDEGVFLTGWEGSPSGWKIYGNVFWSDGGEVNPRGIELRQDYNYSNILIYNNTFVNVPVGAVLNRTAETGNSTTGCEGINNLAYGCSFSWGDFDVNSNNTVATSDPFANRAGDDLRLKAPTAAGTSLPAPYNLDIVRNTRGSDGTWDRGAYEYVAGGTTAGPSASPTIGVSTTTLNFGATQVGSTKDLTFTVQNSGGGTLVGAVTVVSPFSVVSGQTYSLSSGQSQTVTVRYSPSASGVHAGTATLTGATGASVSLTGSGTAPAPSAPAISVSPNSLAFGYVSVGVTKDLSVTVNNTGTGTLAGTASVQAPFSVVNGGTYSLGSNQSQTVTIRYAPTSSGNHNTTVTFTGGGGATVTASGSAGSSGGSAGGTLPGLTFASTAGAITEPFVASGGSVSQSEETDVSNGGRAVYQFAITNAGDYTVSAQVDAPNSGADSFFVNIDAEPTDPTMIWDILPLTSGFQSRTVGWRGSGSFNTPQYPTKVFALSAGTHQLIIVGREPGVKLGTITIAPSASQASAPAISVSPTSLAFGSITVGATKDLSVTVSNTGTGTLTGTASVQAPFSVVSGGTYSLASNQSQTVTIRYAPTSSGNHNTTVTFTGGGGATVTVGGSATSSGGTSGGSSGSTLPGLTFASTAGTITAPFVASAGSVSQADETDVSDGGRAVYQFAITNAGNYTVSAQVDAPNSGADSFFVNIDAEPTDPTMIWDILPLTSGFQSRTVGWRGSGSFNSPQYPTKVFALSAGTHQLIIVGRERGVKLGAISITPSGSQILAPPQGLRVIAP